MSDDVAPSGRSHPPRECDPLHSTAAVPVKIRCPRSSKSHESLKQSAFRSVEISRLNQHPNCDRLVMALLFQVSKFQWAFFLKNIRGGGFRQAYSSGRGRLPGNSEMRTACPHRSPTRRRRQPPARVCLRFPPPRNRGVRTAHLLCTRVRTGGGPVPSRPTAVGAASRESGATSPPPWPARPCPLPNYSHGLSRLAHSCRARRRGEADPRPNEHRNTETSCGPVVATVPPAFLAPEPEPRWGKSGNACAEFRGSIRSNIRGRDRRQAGATWMPERMRLGYPHFIQQALSLVSVFNRASYTESELARTNLVQTTEYSTLRVALIRRNGKEEEAAALPTTQKDG